MTQLYAPYPTRYRAPTHAGIIADNRCIIVQADMVSAVVAALTNDALCGIVGDWVYGGRTLKDLNPDKILQEFEVYYFTPGDATHQKLVSVQSERDSAQSSLEYYRNRATTFETQLKELQSKLDELVAPKAPKADHGDDLF